MSNQEVDETIDEEVIASGETETDNNEEGGDDDNTSNKNKSNFKNLYKKTKEQEKALLEKEEKLAQLEEELEEWRKLNPEVLEDLKAKKSITSVEEKIFALENPEAKPHLKEIRETMKEFNCNFDKAWKLVKVDLPEESKTTKEFDIGKSTTKKITDYTKITLEDSANLTPEQRKEWRKVNGWV